MRTEGTTHDFLLLPAGFGCFPLLCGVACCVTCVVLLTLRQRRHLPLLCVFGSRPFARDQMHLYVFVVNLC
jgi:hypothetical protein